MQNYFPFYIILNNSNKKELKSDNMNKYVEMKLNAFDMLLCTNENMNVFLSIYKI